MSLRPEEVILARDANGQDVGTKSSVNTNLEIEVDVCSCKYNFFYKVLQYSC